MELLYATHLVTIVLGIMLCVYCKQFRKLSYYRWKKGILDRTSLEYRVNRKLRRGERRYLSYFEFR